MFTQSLLLLISGYILVIALCVYLIRKWMIAPVPVEMPRYKTIRQMNIVALVVSSISAIALMTSYYIGRQFSFPGLPILILILIFALCSSPKWYSRRRGPDSR